MTCPKCGAECAENSTECPACGVIFARFEAARAQRAAAEAEAAAEAARRANIEALANEGAEPEPVPQESPQPKSKIVPIIVGGLIGLIVGVWMVAKLSEAPRTPTPPAKTAKTDSPAPRERQPVAREGQWFELTGEAVVGCLATVQLQRILDLRRSGDMNASMRQLREYIDDETCVIMDTPMRVYVETTQGPYALVRKQGGTGTAWIVMPKR